MIDAVWLTDLALNAIGSELRRLRVVNQSINQTNKQTDETTMGTITMTEPQRVS